MDTRKVIQEFEASKAKEAVVEKQFPACPICHESNQVELIMKYEPFTSMTVIGHKAVVIDQYYVCNRCNKLRFG